MNAIRLLVVGFIAGYALVPIPAEASVFAIATAAGACQYYPATGSFSVRSDGEMVNELPRSTGVTHYITCDLGDASAASTSFSPTIYFYDDNNATGMEDDVYCNIISCNNSGSTCTNPGTKFGNASGGTSSATPYSGGQGYIAWSGVTRTTNTTSVAWCNIPGYNTGGQVGSIRRLSVTWN